MSRSKQYILSIDVGTGSGRSILFDMEGLEVAVAQKEWLPKSDPNYPGSQDFDTREAWRLLCETVREVMVKAEAGPDDIAAVTSTAMREGMVLYNRDKEVIWACPNVDARAGDEVIEMVKKDLAEPIYRRGGDWLSITSPPRLWWIRNKKPEIYSEIAHMNMLSDWVLFRLSGELVTDPSIGSSSGMFDLAQRKWSQEIIDLADLPRGIYADVHESGTIIGRVNAEASKETGLKTGTPVVTGGADTQLALIGAGAIKPLMYTVCGGTFWQTTVVTDRAVPDPQYRLRALCHAVPGQWMTEGIGFYHGFTMRWIRDGFCAEEKKQALKEGVDPYTLMERLAERIPPGSNGVQAIFSNIMDVKRWRHAPPSLLGFDLLAPEKTGKAAAIRAIEESTAYVTKGHIDILAELTGRIPREIIFVGGSSKGVLWPRIIADVLGATVHIPVVKESTCLGAAMGCMTALGEYDSLEQVVQKVVRWERRIEPDSENHKVYQDEYQRWLKVYDAMLRIGDDGLLPSLWRAPGV